MWMRPARTPVALAILPVSGPVTDGIGTLGLTPIRSSRTMVFSTTRLVGASTLLGSHLELRTLDTDSVGMATVAMVTAGMATVGSAIVGTSGRDTIRATLPVADLRDPRRMRTTFAVLASLASAAAGASGAPVFVVVWAAAVFTAEVDSMAEADTARTYDVTPLRTAYRINSGRLCRFSFSCRFLRWVSMVYKLRLSTCAISLLDFSSTRS